MLKKARKVAALAQLRDLQVDVAGAGLPETITLVVTAVCPVWAFDIEAGAAQVFDIKLHHSLGNELDNFLEQINICPFLNQLGQCDSGLGHRGFSGEG